MKKQSKSAGPIAIGALVLGCLVAGLLQTIVLQIQDDFPELLQAPREVTGWIVTITILAACAFSPVSSRLGDMLGRKNVIVGLLFIMAAGSLVSAMAPNVWVLIVGRAFQGLAIGVIPLAISVMKDIVAPEKLGGAIALASGTLGIGSALGLPIGAVINEATSWRGIFWTCFILGILAACAIYFTVPATQMRASGSFDVVGAVGLGLGVTALLIGLAQSLSWGWLAAPTLFTLGAGIGILALTMVHLFKKREPIIDIRASLSSRVLLTNMAALLMNFSMMGVNIVFPQLMALPADAPAGLGVDRVISGLVMMTSGVITALATPLIARLSSRFGPKNLMLLGTVIVAISICSSLFIPWSSGLIFAINVGLGLGFGMAFASMPQIIMESVDRSRSAAANGVNAQLRFFGTAMASAVIAAVLAKWSVPFGDGTVPTEAGTYLAIGLCSAGAVLAVILSALIPTKD
ncbi:major facilitator transporter [Corynebacterium suranareeae]|uniref:Major facilitator transporter n=1 Tax=Corynebacterium suranareeae TaxID=2506452 RepID=A0A160PMC7_9CORY|nr:MFS transporter [Corynebacterium suranareeae]BAU94426.1 major facilitator transporter [Corynebacterium suranareeae]